MKGIYRLELIEYLKYRVLTDDLGEIGTVRMDGSLFHYQNDEVSGFTPVIGEAVRILRTSKEEALQ